MSYLSSKRNISVIVLAYTCFWSLGCLAQDTLPNLVPNPGFELLSGLPLNWFNTGRDFTHCMKYWSSPTGASPDAYGKGIKVPSNWGTKGFGKAKPRTGKGMVGLTLYGCGSGKPHCREYIQIPLNEQLVFGQKYEITFWVTHLPGTMEINNIGAYFSSKFYEIETDPLLYFKPHLYSEYILQCDGYWEKISGTFLATSEAEYLIIGNFFPDSLTASRQPEKEGYGFAYYYIDDVSVRKVPPILPIPVRDDDITRAVMEKGNIIPLKYIFFDPDKSELLPRSHVELRKLAGILNQYPSIQLEVRGHTDSRGEESYNLRLSRDRAQAVMDYLLSEGIEAGRLRFRGYGSSQPIATNHSDQGRRQNRRVEICILDR